MYPVCIFGAVPVSADAQFVYAASLHITSAIHPIVFYYNSLHAILALHKLTIGSMLCGITPDKQKNINHYCFTK